MTTADQITAHEDLALFVGDRLPSAGTDWPTVDKTLAALLDGGEIHEEWGARLHAGEPDGDVDTWRDTRAKAEAMLAARVKGGWRERSTLIRRFVIVTAPTVVEDTP